MTFQPEEPAAVSVLCTACGTQQELVDHHGRRVIKAHLYNGDNCVGSGVSENFAETDNDDAGELSFPDDDAVEMDD